MNPFKQDYEIVINKGSYKIKAAVTFYWMNVITLEQLAMLDMTRWQCIFIVCIRTKKVG